MISFKVTFNKRKCRDRWYLSSAWPICINIYNNSWGLVQFTISSETIGHFLTILEDGPLHYSQDFVVFFPSKEGVAYKGKWKSKDRFHIMRRNYNQKYGFGTSGTVVILDEKEAIDLSNKIKAIMQSTPTPTIASSTESEHTPDPDIDPMAGAKKRTNENLDSVFG